MLKNPNGPPFKLFGTMRLIQNSQCFPILGFVSVYPLIFRNTIRIPDSKSEVKRYIRTFNVMSELYCVLHLKGGGGSKTEVFHGNVLNMF